MMSYQETSDWLFSLENMGIKLGLDRMMDLLTRLGAPQRSFHSVHIAGTNGKGSVSAMLASIFQEAGINTGLYTSPHLVNFTERIQVNGVQITETEVVELAAEIRGIIESPTFPTGRKLTFFEITTAMAFLYFKRKRVGMAVVEVGMGGRLDATNLIAPLCTVITRIGLEHTQYLGDTLAKIAYEKAGIIKEGITVITAEDNEEAMRIIDAVARDRAAPLLLLGRDFKYDLQGKGEHGIDVHIQSIHRDVHVPLLGEYQASNAAMACECALEVKKRGVELTDTDMVIGLSKVRWPGRMEIVERDPLLVFDVTHTTEGAKVVAKELKDLHPGPWVLVLGVLNDKDLKGICAEFGPLADRAVATAPKNRRAYPAEVVHRALTDHCAHVLIETDVGAAMDRAYELAGPDDAILVTGSLYVIGEAEQWLAQKRTN